MARRPSLPNTPSGRRRIWRRTLLSCALSTSSSRTKAYTLPPKVWAGPTKPGSFAQVRTARRSQTESSRSLKSFSPDTGSLTSKAQSRRARAPRGLQQRPVPVVPRAICRSRCAQCSPSIQIWAFEILAGNLPPKKILFAMSRGRPPLRLTYERAVTTRETQKGEHHEIHFDDELPQERIRAHGHHAPESRPGPHGLHAPSQ